MMVVHDAKHFFIAVPERPHVSRHDGGHLIIHPRKTVVDRTQLDHEQAIELMQLTMAAGEAMTRVLTQRGIDIGRINYQENGNWRHELHVHLYGRARNATLQPWGQPLKFPPTAQALREEMDNLDPLSAEDAAAIGDEIARLLRTAKYDWGA